MGKLVYDGKSVYEIDEECIRKREQKEKKRQEQMKQQKQTTEQHEKKGCP